MTRLSTTFAKAHPALVTFVTAGDPTPHAIAAVAKRARETDRDKIILANLCGRGDKDIFTVAEALGVEM